MDDTRGKVNSNLRALWITIGIVDTADEPKGGTKGTGTDEKKHLAHLGTKVIVSSLVGISSLKSVQAKLMCEPCIERTHGGQHTSSADLYDLFGLTERLTNSKKM